ncbi:ead/Ea22-like family protein [Escherichia coli]|nr:ead/Ea22-like family protein [Escherichia coli]EFJ8793521.1 ead/Ea22-like family protein [Escherichia coli]
MTDIQALREELSNPAIGSNDHLRKLALSLLDDLEAAKKYAKDRDAENKGLMLTVGRLRVEKETAEKRIAELSAAVIAPGIMRCAGCGFVLTKNNINMAAGTITAGYSKTEPCPNGCGPLWPVTWKEQALEMRDRSEQWFEELQEAQKRITELEARTLRVELPDPSCKAFWGGSGKNETFYPSTYKIWVKESIERAGAIAQVAIKVV